MLLTGTFPRLIDDKGRIAIPKPLRDCLNDGAAQPTALFVAPGTDGSLAIYPESTFKEVGARFSQVSPTARDVRDYSRLFYSQAVRVELDKQGRVRLPQELTQQAGLDKEAVLVGVQDRLELWDRQRWQDYLAEKSAQYDEIAEAAFGGSGTKAVSGLEAGNLPNVPR